MQLWFIIEIITLVIGAPVLAMSYYRVILFLSSLRYPRNLGKNNPTLDFHPSVSILIASFNEKYVIARSLEAMRTLNYPKSKIQVVVADDSTDQTVEIIDREVSNLNRGGIRAVVSRRPTREFFKSGALNKAMDLVEGEYVLLLDSDSIIPPEILIKGIDALRRHPSAAFVSFRYGHYNRDYNLVTQLFAISQDIGDTLTKMGAYWINAPFSCQGGFTLAKAEDLRKVGLWTNERIADDADISIKLQLAGRSGVYLSNVKIMSEDPPTLEAWKKQVGRTSQGLWRCAAKYWDKILTARDVSFGKKLGLFMIVATPFSSMSWIIITFLSALTIVFGVVQPGNSIFSSPIYAAIVTIPYVASFLFGAWALYVQELLTPKNAIFIPLLGYAQGSTMTLASISCFYGVFDRLGFFQYRTPKSGNSTEGTRTKYFRILSNDRNAIIEGFLSIAAIVLAILVLGRGVWLLSLALASFGAFTLKSLNLTRRLRKSEAGYTSGEKTKVAPEIVIERDRPRFSLFG